MISPLVAIVGAPNVGKSTLFNRLVGSRRSIVTDRPGMTRDRIYASVEDAIRPFRLVDTGGLTPMTEAPFAREIERQADAALSEARLVLFVVDARAGVTTLDLELASMLRRRGLRLLLVANKVDADSVLPRVLELHELGLGEPLVVSAEHGRGIEELLEAIDGQLGDGAWQSELADDERAIHVAIVGRPNVGKSSLLNRLLGEERAMVSEIPGTTRDSIDSLLVIGARRYRLIDTAGIRRSGKPRFAEERSSVRRTRRNIERSDVVVLVLDATQPLAAQDAHIAGYVLDDGRPMVILINKWDVVPAREGAAKEWQERVRYRLRFAKEVPILFISAKSGQRVAKVLDLVDSAYEASGLRVPTPELNRWLRSQQGGNPTSPPPRTGLRLYYATQVGTRPPRFLLFCNDPAKVHFSVRRQLENGLRERFGFGPSPIRIDFRGRRPAAE